MRRSRDPTTHSHVNGALSRPAFQLRPVVLLRPTAPFPNLALIFAFYSRSGARACTGCDNGISDDR